MDIRSNYNSTLVRDSLWTLVVSFHRQTRRKQLTRGSVGSKHLFEKNDFSKVSTWQDKLDALSIYGGEEIETLIETLLDPEGGDVTLPANVKPATEGVNEYHNEHVMTMVNKDSARSKFDCITQGDRTVEQYFVELRKQADRCQFADRDDSIRTKILQTMNDKQLRREAM